MYSINQITTLLSDNSPATLEKLAAEAKQLTEQYFGRAISIHHIAKGIDDGNIILQGRPKIEETDNIHTIGCKCAVLGTDLMIKVMRKLFKGEKCPDIRQNKKLGRLYLRKEFTDETIDEINRLTENGLMTEYAKNPKKISIAEW